MLYADMPPDAVPAFVHHVRKKSGSRSNRRSGRTGLFIGAIVILSDGTRCEITHIDANGTAWCLPLE